MKPFEEELLRIIRKNAEHGITQALRDYYDGEISYEHSSTYVDIFQHIIDQVDVMNGRPEKKGS